MSSMLAAECSAGQRHTPRTHAYHARARVCTCCMGAPRCAGARCRTTAGTTLGRARSGGCIQHAGGCVAVCTGDAIRARMHSRALHARLLGMCQPNIPRKARAQTALGTLAAPAVRGNDVYVPVPALSCEGKGLHCIRTRFQQTMHNSAGCTAVYWHRRRCTLLVVPQHRRTSRMQRALVQRTLALATA